MPINQIQNHESETLFVEATGYLTWDERCESAAKFREAFASGTIKYALFDLRGLTADNDAKDELKFGAILAEAISEFNHIRAAVVVSTAFLVSSSVVLRLQQSGFNMMDFRDLAEAKAWLYSV